MAQMNIKQLRGATQGSILFLGTNSTVSEDFSSLNWNESTNILSVSGKILIDDGSQQSGYILVSDSSGLGTWTQSATPSLGDLVDVDITTSTPSVGDRLVYDGVNWVPQTGAFTIDELLDIYPNSGQVISTSGGSSPTAYVDIDWDNQVVVGSSFTHSTVSNTQNIIIQRDGWYEVSFSLSTDNDTSTSRTICNVRLVLDSGSGFVEVPRSLGAIYNRTATAGEGTVSRTVKLNLGNGNILKLQARRFTGTGGLTTVADGSNITITKLT